MSNIIYINENYKLLKSNDGIVEGGLARNIAIMNWLQNNIKGLTEIKLSNNRFFNIFIVLHALLVNKNQTILFQYITVGVPLFNGSLPGKIISNIFLLAVKQSLKFNEIIFDISDLKYEQSIDLEIEKGNSNRIKKVEDILFRLKAKFIFASYSMQEYACIKYSINVNDTEVLINGGNLSENYSENLFQIDPEKINYVYAGTLNPGRKIEEMINQFPNQEEIHLYLMGSGGEWILDYLTQKNITFIGAYSEEEAHEIVRRCDIGLIPYDNNRQYFNIAYPTKLSFYLTAGIPFLSTPVNEVIKIYNQYQVGYVEEMNNWKSFIMNLDKTSLKNEKNKISEIVQDFTWVNIISKSKLLTTLTK